MLGYVYHYRGNLNISIQHYESARRLYNRVNNFDRVATVDLNLGENYRFKGDFDQALRLFRAAYKMVAELGNLRIQTLATVAEGLTLLTVAQYTRAFHVLEQGLQLTHQWTGDDDKLTEILCEIYHGMAVIHLKDGDTQSAWHCALQALEIAYENEYPLHLGYANRTMGEVITQCGNVPDSDFASDPDEYFKAALNAFKSIHAEAEIARTMFAQGMSLAARGRRTTAGRLLQQAMIIFTRLDMVDDAARAAEAQLAVL